MQQADGARQVETSCQPHHRHFIRALTAPRAAAWTQQAQIKGTSRACPGRRVGGPQHFRAWDEISSGPQVNGLVTYPCRLRGPKRFTSWDKTSSGPQVGGLATSPLPSGVPDASKWGTKSAVAHNCADWLRHPCRVGGPQCFIVCTKISSGPQVGALAMPPLPFQWSPML